VLYTKVYQEDLTLTSMKFSDKILQRAIESLNGELAWKRNDVLRAINELTDNKYAILGGDVWAIVANELSLTRLTQIDSEKIAVGIIKGKDGQDYVFNWYSNKGQNETWDEYVKRSKKETIDSIDKMNAEESVSEELSDSIFYNLVFADKEEFEKLRQ
jgi:hypothetical protein